MVIRRQRKVMQSAITANAIVSSIFPATVQDRLLQNAEEEANKKGGGPARHGGGFPFGPQRHLHSGEKEETKGLVTAYSTKPIADLFTHATVMFADIAGFTGTFARVDLFVLVIGSREAHTFHLATLHFQHGRAYEKRHKVRNNERTMVHVLADETLFPYCALSSVFILLETVYASFDRVAKALKVFKVETIGMYRSGRHVSSLLLFFQWKWHFYSTVGGWSTVQLFAFCR
jgi:hypothetical protein